MRYGKAEEFAEMWVRELATELTEMIDDGRERGARLRKLDDILIGMGVNNPVEVSNELVRNAALRFVALYA